MDIIHRSIITLLRSAITDQRLPLPEGFSLEAADKLVRKQGLLPIIYQGAFRCGVAPDDPLMIAYQAEYFQQMIRSGRQMAKAEQLFAAFDKAGIDYLPLKGCVLKPLYPRQELRVMGDADILIRMAQYDTIKPVMTNLGFREDVWSAYDVHWCSDELLAELHFKLFSDNQSEQNDFRTYFANGWSKAHLLKGSRYTFTPEDHFLYIFAHMTKHFRFCGIGARQIMDLYVFRTAYPELNEVLIAENMEKMGLLQFYRNILRLLDVWFAGAQSDSTTELITAYIFSGGSFGTTRNKMFSEEVLRARETSDGKGSKLRAVWKTLFPEKEYLQLSYNVLYRHPWLYPLFWVVRWCDILINRRYNIGKRVKILRTINDESVEAHRRLLRDMGLNY